MQTTADRPTSGTIGNPVAPRFAQDQQTRTWVLSDNPPAMPPRADVLRYAQRELAALRRLPKGWDGGKGVALRPGLATLALLLVDLVTVDDGLATPQFSPLPNGGLYITWLVGGDRLAIELEPEGMSVRGVLSGGSEVFNRDFEPNPRTFLQSELEGAINEARSFLLKISTRVQHQLLTS
jgi:hypothetical protein